MPLLVGFSARGFGTSSAHQIRRSSKHGGSCSPRSAATLPKPPEGKGPGGGPPLPKDELDVTRYSAVGDVVYGVAAVDGALLIRTGTELICVRGAGRSGR